MLRPRRP